MLIHLIRHTTPDVEPGICYGQADLGLSPSFSEEREIVLSKLLPEYDALITSPLIRCALLAESVKALNRSVDERIKEYDFGDWELKPWAEIKRKESKQWMDDFVNVPCPNGESVQIMKQRVDDFFAELMTKPHKTVAIVTHSGVQRLLHAYVLGTPLHNMFRLQLDFGAVLEINLQHKSGLLTIKHL